MPPNGDPPVSRTAIYGRCVDAIRFLSREERFTFRLSSRRKRDILSVESVDVDPHLVETIINNAKIDQSQQKVIFHRFYLGQTLSEMAASLGMTVSQVSVVLNKTLEQLRAAVRINNERER